MTVTKLNKILGIKKIVGFLYTNKEDMAYAITYLPSFFFWLTHWQIKDNVPNVYLKNVFLNQVLHNTLKLFNVVIE